VTTGSARRGWPWARAWPLGLAGLAVAVGGGGLALGAAPASAASSPACGGTASSYTIAAVAGTPQSAKVGQAFATDLVVQVLEGTPTGSCPAAGVEVTFSTPSSGPSASFNGGALSVSVETGQDGEATAPTLYANGLVGSYTVTASASVTSAVASFSLANTTVGAPALVQATSGEGQSATVGTSFANPLVVTVTDAYGGPVAGAEVSFVVVASQGAGASFAGGGQSAQVATNAEGEATSPLVTAGATAGSFTVQASVPGVAPASFELTNLASAPYSISAGPGSGQQAPLGTDFAVPLAVTVADANGNPVAGAAVTFTAPASGPSGVFANGGHQVTVAANASGVATAPALSAATAPGGYVVVARVAGLAEVASFALVNTARTTASAPGPPGSYWAATSGGKVLASGAAASLGWPRQPAGPVVAMAALPGGRGYWLASAAGHVYAYGQAAYLGAPALRRGQGQVVAMAATPDGRGYWLATSAGAVYAFGDARSYGSPLGQGLRLASPVVGLAPTPDGRGYWLAARDGGTFAYGDARYLGSAAGLARRSPLVAIAPAAQGLGYWLLSANGGVFAYGSATFYGSAVGLLGGPARALVPTPGGAGYWVMSGAGTVAGFGDAGAQGSVAPPKGSSVVAGAAA